eukprot:scaffold3039_cov194-Pinguiococcus_pyrenoidosus.AAC.2
MVLSKSWRWAMSASASSGALMAFPLSRLRTPLALPRASASFLSGPALPLGRLGFRAELLAGEPGWLEATHWVHLRQVRNAGSQCRLRSSRSKAGRNAAVGQLPEGLAVRWNHLVREAGRGAAPTSCCNHLLEPGDVACSSPANRSGSKQCGCPHRVAARTSAWKGSSCWPMPASLSQR